MTPRDWVNTKATYRFLQRPDGSGESNFSPVILLAHLRRDFPLAVASPSWFFTETATGCLIGTKIPHRSESSERYPPGHKGSVQGLYTRCGILMHSSLVTTRDGLPLGLAAIKFWNRDKFYGANALKRQVNPTRVPIEKKESIRWLENLRQSTELLADPGRCVHIGDRETTSTNCSVWLSSWAHPLLVRTCVDRRAGDGEHTVRDVMKQAPVRGLHRVLECETSRNSRLQFLKFAVDAWWSAHPSASRKTIRN